MFWGEFQVGDGAFQVSGFQSDFVAFDERSESLVVTQGHDLVSEGFVSSSNEGLKADSTVGIEESEIKERRAWGSYPIMR